MEPVSTLFLWDHTPSPNSPIHPALDGHTALRLQSCHWRPTETNTWSRLLIGCLTAHIHTHSHTYTHTRPHTLPHAVLTDTYTHTKLNTHIHTHTHTHNTHKTYVKIHVLEDDSTRCESHPPKQHIIHSHPLTRPCRHLHLSRVLATCNRRLCCLLLSQQLQSAVNARLHNGD